jgi:uncharacterized membrane protein
MEKYQKNWVKFILGFVFCMLVRLIPFRPPNVEPILATQMPFSKAYGSFAGFLFAFFSIIFFDLITGHYGIWSFLTAGTYGVLGFWAFYFFKKREPTHYDYVLFAIIGTLFFDCVTGLSIGPLFFHQSFTEALVGQIPFTLWHLAGNTAFAFILSPAIYQFIIKNEKFETGYILNIFNHNKSL